MAPHSSTLAWKIPWKEEPGRLQSMGSLESDMTERLPFHFSLSCIGEGNGNPLQCSCLENSRDGGAWWATVHGVTKSWTWLSDFTLLFKELLQDIRSVKIRILTYPNPFFDFVHASKILCNLWGFFWCNLWGYLQYPLSMSTFEWMNKWNLQKKIHIFHTHCFISSSRILSHGVYSLSPKSSCREGL